MRSILRRVREFPRSLAMTAGTALLVTAALVIGVIPASASVAPNPNPPTLQITANAANAVSLSSRPGAAKTIWLVFDPGTLENSRWNNERTVPGDVDTPLDFAAATGDSVALRTAVFDRVSEMYSPFDVNVTTVRPTDAQLERSAVGDEEFGAVAIITASSLGDAGLALDSSSPAGIAYLDAFGDPMRNYAWVSTPQLSGNAQSIAGTVAHEVGHTLGLTHQGIGADEYYRPTSGLWAPIMGDPNFVPVSRWSDGQYTGATNSGQNDLTVMTDPAGDQQWTIYFMRATGEPVPAGQFICNAGSDPEWLPDAGGPCNIADAADPARVVDHTDYFSGRLDFAADDFGNDVASASALALPGGAGTVTGVVGRTGDSRRLPSGCRRR